MKKNMKKITAMGLTAAMLLSLTACGGSNGETASADAEQTSFKIFAGISALSPDNSEKPLVKQLNEAMGVTIEWNCVSGDTLTEKKNLILNAGNDLPDALMAASMTDSELITGGESGLLIPLEDYINEETMPNLMKIVEKRPEMLASCTMPDGHIYGLPGISEMGFEYEDGNTYYIGAIPQFTAINTDWLEAVNMEMPTTVDELHDVLKAFKDNDVNGNGDPTDEIPMSFIFPEKNGAWCAGMSTFFAPFGCTDYQMDHRAIENGEVYYQAASEEYKNAIAYYHDWFEEGLIDIEVFSQDSSQYIAKGNGEDARLGVFVWWEIPEVVGAERAESYEYLPILDGPDGTHHVNLNEMGTTGHDTFSVTKACKNPELLLKWVDQRYDPIISMQCIYGPIGTYWAEEPDENGCYSMRELEANETAGELKSKSEWLGPSEQLADDYGTYYYLEDRAQERLDDLNNFWFEYVDSTEYYPSVVYTAEEIEVINDKLSDIKAMTEEKTAHWLTEGGIEDEWEQYLADLDSMGLQDVIGAWQAAYDRYQEALAD
ncbi:MAG: extracellular solute-binding protein [Eubacteriales bacterium]|nr:extracellular solute-binding protein [Eubacteriales bacterium]